MDGAGRPHFSQACGLSDTISVVSLNYTISVVSFSTVVLAARSVCLWASFEARLPTRRTHVTVTKPPRMRVSRLAHERHSPGQQQPAPTATKATLAIGKPAGAATACSPSGAG